MSSPIDLLELRPEGLLGKPVSQFIDSERLLPPNRREKARWLGLSSFYGILEQANGHIMFTSQPGHRTTFCIFLPRLEVAPPADPPKPMKFCTCAKPP